MKKEEIKIRVSQTLKKDFKNICEFEQTTMSNKLNDYIFKEVFEKKYKNNEIMFNELLKIIGSNNITIIKDSSELLIINNEPKRYFANSYQCNFIDFVNKNKDKKIYLFLLGSNFLNNEFRAFLI